MRWFALVLATVAVFGSSPPVAHASSSWMERRCRYQYLDHHKGWTTVEVASEIRCAVAHFGGVPGGVPKALAVAECESGLSAGAYNPGGYGGVYQQDVDYWRGRLQVLRPPNWNLGPSVFNARSNVVISIAMARGGWAPWGCAWA